MSEFHLLPEPQNVQVFEIQGRAETTTQTYNGNSESVSTLNEFADEIAEEISNSVRQSFPATVVVQTQLQFSEGSLTWSGIVEIIDWANRIVGIVDFAALAISLIQFASERAVRRSARKYRVPLRFDTVHTTVLPRTPSGRRESNTDILLRTVIARQEEQAKLLQQLIQTQDSLTRAIGQLQRDRSSANKADHDEWNRLIRSLNPLKAKSTTEAWAIIIVDLVIIFGFLVMCSLVFQSMELPMPGG